MYRFGLKTPTQDAIVTNEGFAWDPEDPKNVIVLVTVTGGGVVPMYKGARYFNYWEPIFTLSPKIIDNPG